MHCVQEQPQVEVVRQWAERPHLGFVIWVNFDKSLKEEGYSSFSVSAGDASHCFFYIWW